MSNFKHTVTVPGSVGRADLNHRIRNVFRWLQAETNVRWTAKRTPRVCRISGGLMDTSVTFTVNARDTLPTSEHGRVVDILDHTVPGVGRYG